jgi:nitrogenase molybdenum-iron protein alpha/beta subunit/MoaA/NifB/PqqE/SkfB family radical SAM enzyme/predicted Fe-Mo cluster-binding NifX family protein
MRGTLVNLNVNPCKMCMPMGSMTAMYGIKKCVSILHGSQGCSTYIRRHMATHYNEPVDIASSSLTEEGTVYGGEKNLLQGLSNLIRIYQPEVIGVATTCLAETIGEDISRIIDKFHEENPQYRDITIIGIPSAGYAGTQYEGFMKALYHIVRSVPMEAEKNGRINVVTSQLSSADTRYLKELLKSFGINYILLPDLSENLDGGHQAVYKKLPQAGTDIRDIRKMAGASFTLELSSGPENIKSVAEYLYESYGIPYKKCNLPVSLRDNDELLKLLKEISGRAVPSELLKERDRLLDAMIDSHKYNGETRAAVYGEPDFVYSTVRMCVENGIMPMIAATGSRYPGFQELLDKEIQPVADAYYIESFKILEDVDFQTIEEHARELKVNLLIGNSDGRRIAEKLGIPLVRRSFPVHDRVGGQRLRTLGYRGALTFLDDISNAVLGRKEESFREELYDKYYKRPAADRKEDKTATHPCYNCGAHQYARMHLPVAPGCNISCNYCLRKYDCPNESRPGVTTSVLKPEEALLKFLEVRDRVSNLSVVGIAGPGDALANFEETKKTLTLIREKAPEITFCLSTNGLLLPQYAQELITLGVSHVTVTVNAVDPLIGARIYRHVDYMGTRYFGEAAAAILLSSQLAGIRMLTSRGVACKVNIVMLKGINERHIPDIVAKVKDLGAVITNIMQMIPVKGSAFEQLPLVSNREILEMRNKCSAIMKQMYHCRQCRADAVGTLEHDRSIEFNAPGGTAAGIVTGKDIMPDKDIATDEDVMPDKDMATGKDVISDKDMATGKDVMPDKDMATGKDAMPDKDMATGKDIMPDKGITPDKDIAPDKGIVLNKDIMPDEYENSARISGIQVAVATKSGMNVDQHFGQVSEFYVYEYLDGKAVFMERRTIEKYCTGVEDCDERDDKLERIIRTISDCKAVIAMRIGDSPRTRLNQRGIRTFTTFDRIEDSVKKAASEIISGN